MNHPPTFDASPTLHAEIVPLMQQLMKICQRERIPMVVAVCPVCTAEGFQLSAASISHSGWLPLPMRQTAAILEATINSRQCADHEVLADLRKPLAPSHTYTQTYDPPAA
jgi:hypothetical protein